MPHKMNTRSCERVNGLAVVLRGYASMVGELAGDQWNEGDVSCSVVRRVALPDAFYAADGLFETFLTVLDEFGVFPAVIQRELDRYLPFLATTKVLMASVRNGLGRETAYDAVKQHAVAVALEMREKGAAENDLFARLAADERLGLSEADLATPGRLADRVHGCRGQPGARRRRPHRADCHRKPRSRGLHSWFNPVVVPRREGAVLGFLGDVGSVVMTPLYYVVSAFLLAWREIFGLLLPTTTGGRGRWPSSAWRPRSAS